MTKSERTKELERENFMLKERVQYLESDIKILERKLDAATELKEHIPSSCEPSQVCKACYHAVEIKYMDGYMHTCYVCGKEPVCVHFIQKEIKE